MPSDESKAYPLISIIEIIIEHTPKIAYIYGICSKEF
jgi:hypothetical protein